MRVARVREERLEGHEVRAHEQRALVLARVVAPERGGQDLALRQPEYLLQRTDLESEVLAMSRFEFTVNILMFAHVVAPKRGGQDVALRQPKYLLHDPGLGRVKI